MPRPFLELTAEQFADLVKEFPWRRRVTSVHVHHTWRPNHADFHARPAIQAIESMFRFHTKERGFADIAQHVTIDPHGKIWTGRNWNQPPASASGFNGNTTAGPFMFEMIGDFDKGRDPWDGDQRDAAIDVIAIIQLLWNLPPEAFRFHGEMSSKSCPGSGLDKADILSRVKAARARMATPSTRSLSVTDRSTTDRLLQLLSVEPSDATRAFSGDEGELPEAGMSSREISALTNGTSNSNGDDRAVHDDTLMPEDLHRLQAHVINLRMGAFSTGGIFESSPAQVRAIFTEHLPDYMERTKASPEKPLRLVFYAHGGLSPEDKTLMSARDRIDFYLQNGCYPIFFIWETGPVETLVDILGEILGLKLGRGFGEAITDLSDAGFEKATAKVGFSMWANMKLSAERGFQPRMGGMFLVEQIAAFWRDNSTRMQIHAIGHSAGSIMHAHFVDALCAASVNPPVKVQSVHFLAPAITTALFADTLLPLVGGRVAEFTEYTMNQFLEKADTVGPYRKSLLYLVSRAFEDNRKEPILGLEESIRLDPDLMRFFGLIGTRKKGTILFSKREDTPSTSTIAAKHGDFDNDRRTMNSVIRRIIGAADTDAIVDFPEAVARDVFSMTPLASETMQAEAPPQATAFPAVATDLRASGRKLAVCIGIDAYSGSNRLHGCVNDARDWERALRGLGYQTQLMTDAQATWRGLVDALKSLVSTARSGDSLVLQYAGHGTRVRDLDGDEVSGQDSALVPVDFDRGGFLIDDDVYKIFRTLPAGVNLTAFFDCCHSGTITRMLASRGPKLGPDVLVRGFEATEEMNSAHAAFREELARTEGERGGPIRGPEGMREISFTACNDAQTAKEIAGHGQFTTHALPILEREGNLLTNAGFLQKVLAKFPTQRLDQTPGLDCAPASRNRPMFRGGL
jgi:hypothetical protein